MADMNISIGASVSGPIADGSATTALREWLDASKKDVADQAVDKLRAVRMDRTGRATGHYQGMIRSRLVTFNDLLIDNPVIYGPWLEGTSKRNESTRFKGYKLWRRTKLQMARQAPSIAEKKLDQYRSRIGMSL